MLFLAQSAPDAAALKSFLEVGFYLVGLIAACVGLYMMLSGKTGKTEVGPSPLIVKAEDAYTPLDKHEALAKRVDNLQSGLNDRLSQMASAASAGREKLHLKLNSQGELLASNTAKTNQTADHVEKLEDKIDDNTKLTERLGGELTHINQNLHLLLTRLGAKSQ